MLISCEKCSTTYDLDESLLPASGAAVQCTRCQHVFTAFPPRPVGSVLEDEPTTSRKRAAAAAAASAGIPQGRPANQTMVFGASAAGASPQANAGGPNQTMVFGAAPAIPAGANPNQTMMFGAAGGAAPAPAPQPAPARPANQTMVFGTAAGQQLASAPAAPAAPANQTMVFGSSAQPAPPPAQNPNSTMMFGTPAAQAPAQPSSVGGASPNQTLVFGAQPPVAAAQPKSTQMFGAQPAPAQPKSTGAPAAAAKPSTSTMMFGKPPEAVQASPSKTMAFGAPVVGKKGPVVTASAPEPADETEGAPRSESTVRVDLERMMRERDEGEDPPPEPARHDRTQLFAMTSDSSASESTPGEGSQSVQDRHNRTALFAMSTLQETTKPDGQRPASTAPELHGVSEPTVSMDSTLPPDSTIPARLPGDQFGFDEPGTDPRSPNSRSTDLNPGLRHPLASTLPNLPPIAGEQRNASTLKLDLDSAPMPILGGGTVQEPEGAQDEVEALASQSRRRNVVAIVVVLFVVLLAALGVLWQLFGKQLFAQQIDPKWRETVAQSLEKLRRDDHDVRVSEIKRLEDLLKEAPTYADGHAALVTALALEFDDLHAERGAVALKHGRLYKLVKAGNADSELAKRVNQLVEDSRKMDKELEGLDAQLKKAFTALKALNETSDGVARAEALMLAVSGAPPSAKAGDAWFALLPATRALAAIEQESTLQKPGVKDELSAALKVLETLSQDPEWSAYARPHFLIARLHHALERDDDAKRAVAKALELSPKFKAAAGLKAVLEQ